MDPYYTTSILLIPLTFHFHIDLSVRVFVGTLPQTLHINDLRICGESHTTAQNLLER